LIQELETAILPCFNRRDIPLRPSFFGGQKGHMDQINVIYLFNLHKTSLNSLSTTTMAINTSSKIALHEFH